MPQGGRPQATAATRFRAARDPLRVSLFILVVLTVSRIHQQLGFVARLRPALVLTFMVVGYAYLNPKFLAKGNILRVWPAKGMAALGLLACLSVPFGISMGNSGKFILDVYSKNLAVAFLIIAATRSARDLYTFIWAYVVGSSLLGYLALFVFKLEHYGGDSGYMRLSGLLSWDANDVGCVLMVGLVLTLLILQVGSPKEKLAGLVVLAGIGATVARSGSRGGLLGLVAVALALVVMLRQVALWKRAMVIAVAAVGLLLYAPPGYWDQMSTMLTPKEDYNWTSIDGRKALAERGMGYMWSHPIFGVGINNFGKAECTISDKADNRLGGPIRCTAPHNSFIQAGAELGVGGLLLWGGMLLGGIVGLIRMRHRLPRAWARGTKEDRFLYYACEYFPVAIVGFTVTAYFLSFAWLEIYYILFALVGSLYLSIQARVRGGLPAAAPAPVMSGERGGAAMPAGQLLLDGRFPAAPHRS
jgi:O-antigen ligase